MKWIMIVSFWIFGEKKISQQESLEAIAGSVHTEELRFTEPLVSAKITFFSIHYLR